MPSVVFAFGDSSKEVDLKDINSVEDVASNMKEVITKEDLEDLKLDKSKPINIVTMKTVKMEEEKFNNLIRYIEDERAECIERDVELSEDLKDAYEAISEIFNQIHP